jgi:hypothetical protein
LQRMLMRNPSLRVESRGFTMLRVIPGRYGSSSGFRRDLKLKIVGRTWEKRAEELRGETSAGIAESS